MEDLIKALQIFLKYANPKWPTNCEHDVLYVDVDESKVSEDDLAKLADLGFLVDEEEGGFISYRFGSC